MRLSRFSKFAWVTLVYNLLVIAWGVYVRASKSGDGCGSHWPLCDGDSTPLMGDTARWVEASHRISTSIAGVLALILFVWTFRKFQAGSGVRKGASLFFGMTIFEALIGAVLVKFKLVTDNDTALRAGVMAMHVISTYFLMGSITYTALLSSGHERPDLKRQGSVLTLLVGAFLALVLMGVSGSISALGHQLKPVDNVLAASLNPATHWMVRLQPLHPLLAITVGFYLLLLSGLLTHLRPSVYVRRAAQWVVGLYAFQMVVGAFNILLKAPITMQMFHLTMADVSVVSVVALGMLALAPSVKRVEQVPAAVSEDNEEPLTGRKLVNAYIVLTKPRVISLLLFTTLTALFAAAGGWPGAGEFFACFIGGYMAAGSANAINMVIDRDIDANMARTAKRPTVTQKISSTNALVFAFVLAVGSFAILCWGANLLAAMLSFAGLAFYVVIYTLLLKRRTWHNIVIGGAAGAFPPLVGWTAHTNQLSPLAWILFAIIFVWTPVHFWALAIMLKDDYSSANIPMLPVVHGDRATVIQILCYAVVTVVVSILPVFFPVPGQPHVALLYLVFAVVLNIVLLMRCVQLFVQTDRPHAVRLFKFSMIYLAILFLVFAIDCSIPKTGSSSTQTSVHQGRFILVRQDAAPDTRMECA